MSLSLNGKKILVTGVSRSLGIGAAIATLLAKEGAEVVIHGNPDYDSRLGYKDASQAFGFELENRLQKEGYKIYSVPCSDLSQKNACEKTIKISQQKLGYLDGLVINHAYSVCRPIGEWTETHINAHLMTNVTGSMMLIQEFAKQLPVEKRGAITLFTSGQDLGPMIKEIAYAVSKAALIGLCKQVAMALADQNIQVNCINPGPTDTGYLEGADYELVKEMFPMKRWGVPTDAARLVHFLQSDYASWITGEVIASEGGFRRDIILE